MIKEYRTPLQQRNKNVSESDDTQTAISLDCDFACTHRLIIAPDDDDDTRNEPRYRNNRNRGRRERRTKKLVSESDDTQTAISLLDCDFACTHPLIIRTR